jgi:hypothetical protein
MKPKSQRDLVAGLLFVVVGLAFAWGSTEYEFGNAANPGPGYFPFGLGVLLALLGGFTLFKAMSIETRDGERIGSIGWRPLLIIPAAIVFFAFALPRLGLPLTVALVTFGVSFSTTDVRPLQSVMVAVGLAVFCTAVFIGGLNLNLPVKPAPLSSWGIA